MKTSSVLLLSLLLAALLVVGYFAGIFTEEKSSLPLPEWRVLPADVRAIEISASQTPTLKLMKDANGWQIAAPQTLTANQDVVTRFLNQLSSLKLETVVSENPAQYRQYGVDSTARAVMVTTDLVQKLYVGITTPDQSAFYIRLANDPRIFRAKGVLNTSADLKDWRSQTILQLPAGDVMSIQVTLPSTTYTVDLEKAWQVTANDKTVSADSASVQRWLNRFQLWQADSYLPDLKATTVTTGSTHKLVFTRKSGAPITVTLRQRTDDVIGLVNTSPDVFGFSLPQLSLHTPDPDQLTRMNLPTPAAEIKPTPPPSGKKRRGEEGESGL